MGSSQRTKSITIDYDWEFQLESQEKSSLLKHLSPTKHKSAQKSSLQHTQTIPRQQKQSDQCTICLSQFNTVRGKLPCRHTFCYKCIERWAQSSTICPCCRHPFTSIQKCGASRKAQIIQFTPKAFEFDVGDYYICYRCGRGDDDTRLLVCDVCDYNCCHTYCDPVLNGILPQGDWYCESCRSFARSSASRHSPQLRNNRPQDRIPMRTRSREYAGASTSSQGILRRLSSANTR